MSEDSVKNILQMINHASIVAWEGIATTVLPPRSRRYQLDRKCDLHHFSHRDPYFRGFCSKHNYMSKKEPIIGWVTKEEADIEKGQSLLEEVNKKIKSKQAKEWATAEILAKIIAYRALQPKMELSIPVNGKMVPFVVDKVFDLWKEMRAFGLIPLEKGVAPIILFRGTDFSLLSNSSRISVVSNFDPAGPGFSIYMHARSKIKRWIDKQGVQVRALGYSLGGSMVAYALLKDPQLFSQEESSYLFNHPGFAKKSYEMWEGISEEKRPLIHAFVSDGDVVSKYGKLFDNTYGIKHHKILPPIEAHTRLLFLQPSVRIKKVDLEKENGCKSRKRYSNLHKSTTGLFFNVGFRLFLPVP